MRNRGHFFVCLCGGCTEGFFHERQTHAACVCQVHIDERGRHAGEFLLYFGRHLFCGAGAWHTGACRAEPCHTGLQLCLRRGAFAGNGRGHAVCCVQKPGRRARCRRGVWLCAGHGRRVLGRGDAAGGVCLRAPDGPAGGVRRCGRHDANLPAGDAAVFAGVYLQRGAGVLCAQRWQPAAGHAIHRDWQLFQYCAGLRLYLPPGHGHVWRHFCHGALAGVGHSGSFAALVFTAPGLSCRAAAPERRHGRNHCLAGAAGLSGAAFLWCGDDYL